MALSIWIALETGLAMPPPPAILVLSKEELSQVALGRSWKASDDIPALYDLEGKTIYLRNDWRITDLRSRATLVHELVHHTQAFNKVPARCPADREPLAYSLALKWLREQGAADPHAVLGIDEFSIWIRSLCPEG